MSGLSAHESGLDMTNDNIYVCAGMQSKVSVGTWTNPKCSTGMLSWKALGMVEVELCMLQMIAFQKTF